ncbi:hypothetical protein BD560DRAFT_439285 [Blakeslea trispora]|nr:hypothetical protein BD560DRAFT_439285 [Blakeslea trispora]
MQMDDELRQDILDYFPTLLDHSYKMDYALAKKVPCGQGNNLSSQNDNIDLTHCLLRWQISFQTLVDIDDIKQLTNGFPISESAHRFLEPYIEQPVQLDRWHWQEKSKSFPLIQIKPYPTLTKTTDNEKTQLTLEAYQDLKSLVDLVPSFSTEVDRPTLDHPDFIIVNREVLAPSFLPQHDLDQFKPRQFTLKHKTDVQPNELEFARFKF